MIELFDSIPRCRHILQSPFVYKVVFYYCFVSVLLRKKAKIKDKIKHLAVATTALVLVNDRFKRPLSVIERIRG